MAIIRTPVEGWTGESASVWFYDGVAETNDPKLIEWFKEKGYIVEEGELPENYVEDQEVDYIPNAPITEEVKKNVSAKKATKKATNAKKEATENTEATEVVEDVTPDDTSGDTDA